jgi:hypothetical protein
MPHHTANASGSQARLDAQGNFCVRILKAIRMQPG